MGWGERDTYIWALINNILHNTTFVLSLNVRLKAVTGFCISIFHYWTKQGQQGHDTIFVSSHRKNIRGGGVYVLLSEMMNGIFSNQELDPGCAHI